MEVKTLYNTILVITLRKGFSAGCCSAKEFQSHPLDFQCFSCCCALVDSSFHWNTFHQSVWKHIFPEESDISQSVGPSAEKGL